MTLRELRNLVEEFRELQKQINYIRSNKTLSRDVKNLNLTPLKIKLEEVKAEIVDHSKLFVVPASVLNLNLKQAFIDKAETYDNTNLEVHQCERPTRTTPTEFEPTYDYHYDIKVNLVVNGIGEYNLYSWTQNYLMLKETMEALSFDVNVLHLLFATRIRKEIIEACWGAVEDEVRRNARGKIADNNRDKNLLQKKLEVLVNEAKRSAAIAQLCEQIEEIDNINKDLGGSVYNLTID